MPQHPQSPQPAPATHTTAMPNRTTNLPAGGTLPGLAHSATKPHRQGNMLLVALAMAIVSVILLNLYIELVKQNAKTDSFTVYKLTQNVEPGDVLDESSVVAVEVPATEDFEQAMENMVRKDNALNAPARNGDSFTMHASAGQMLTHRMFAPLDETELEKVVPRNRVAYAVPVTRKNLISIIRPGADINLQGLFVINGELRGEYIMKKVRVVAINGQSWLDEIENQGNSRIGSYVSLDLEVTDEENLALMALKEHVKGNAFEVSLCNPHDTPDFSGINTALTDLIRTAPASMP